MTAKPAELAIDSSARIAGTPARPATRRHSTADDWRLLYYFNFYRMILAVVLFLFSHMTLHGATDPVLGNITSDWSTVIIVLITLSCIGNFYTISRHRPRFTLQANYQVLLDIVLVSALIYVGHNIPGPLEPLLVVSIAAAGVMLSTRMMMFNAAVATVLSLVVKIYGVYWLARDFSDLRAVGLLGIALFTTGYVLRFASRRIRATEEVAAQRQQEAVDLDRLNSVIVDNMNRGVVAIDEQRNLQLANRLARRYFELTDRDLSHRLGAAIPQLDVIYTHWRDTGSIEFTTLAAAQDGVRLAPTFITGDGFTLLFLEDTSEERKRADQAKFAALGRMAAAIAHEVRNPLSAISHAGQLLAESPDIPADDRGMLGIIKEHADRIENIIGTVLNLSNQQRQQVDFGLLNWLREFRATFAQSHELPVDAIRLHGADLRVRFDAAHLDQIMTNLFVNAIRCSAPYKGTPLIEVIVRMTARQTAPSLDVVDAGCGVPEDIRERIFEPFFSTRPNGTGLGLYIARQLCEINEAQLDLVGGDDGARFRITFDPNQRYYASSA